MDDDAWGYRTAPATDGPVPPLPPRLAELAELTGPQPLGGGWAGFPAPDELPEVQALAPQGWRPLAEEPRWTCLPAVWPAEHRCWVPDRLPRVVIRSAGDTRRWLVPWDVETRRRWLSARDDEADECGLPAPPTGRLWLLRSPRPSLGLEVLLQLIWQRCEERRLDAVPGGVLVGARELLGWSEDRVWSWWSGPQAEAATRWREQGRAGEEVAELVLAGLGPEQVAALGLAQESGGAGLTEGQCAAWAQALGTVGQPAVELIAGWRALGLPAQPPPGADWVLTQVSPLRAAAWFAAGFTLDELGMMCGIPLASAVDWREHGFTPDDVVLLLDADPELTPAEARAFTAAGLTPQDRLRWVEAGFDASQAQSWADVDVLPDEARAWRSQGLGPADAARTEAASDGSRLPREAGWTGTGTGRTDRRYGVVDPPGTRGRLAREAAERPDRPGRPTG